MRFRAHPQVRHRELGEETLLVHLESGEILSLNATAGRIWELIAGGSTLAETLATLEEEFEVEAGAVRDEVERTLRQLLAKGLLELRSDRPAAERNG